MEHALLGRSGLRVSRLGLGSVNFGTPTGADEALAVMAAALETGMTLWDTSNQYNDGAAEELVGEGLARLGHRDEIVLASKVFYPRSARPNDRGGGRRHLLLELESQLRRLRTDRIDLYFLHRADRATPLEETMATLDGLVDAGKIRHWGMSTHPAWRIVEACWLAERRGFVPPIAEQSPYNLLDRRLENERLPMLLEYGLGCTVWAPLAGGVLSGKYSPEALDEPPPGTRLADRHARLRPRVGRAGLPTAQRLASLAREAGFEPIAFAIAWLLARPGVSSVVAGPRSAAQLPAYLAALDVRLDPDVLAAVDRIVPPGGAVSDFHDNTEWFVGGRYEEGLFVGA